MGVKLSWDGASSNTTDMAWPSHHETGSQCFRQRTCGSERTQPRFGTTALTQSPTGSTCTQDCLSLPWLCYNVRTFVLTAIDFDAAAPFARSGQRMAVMGHRWSANLLAEMLSYSVDEVRLQLLLAAEPLGLHARLARCARCPPRLGALITPDVDVLGGEQLHNLVEHRL